MITIIATYNVKEDCIDKFETLAKEIQNADAVIIGAGAGMSTAAGFIYNGPR